MNAYEEALNFYRNTFPEWSDYECQVMAERDIEYDDQLSD